MTSEAAPTDLTVLMSLDPMDLTKQDLDRIIQYQRKQRAMREGGAKTKKESGAPAVDIKALLGKIQKPEVPTTRPTTTKMPESAKAPSGGGFVRRF